MLSRSPAQSSPAPYGVGQSVKKAKLQNKPWLYLVTRVCSYKRQHLGGGHNFLATTEYAMWMLYLTVLILGEAKSTSVPRMEAELNHGVVFPLLGLYEF